MSRPVVDLFWPFYPGPDSDAPSLTSLFVFHDTRLLTTQLFYVFAVHQFSHFGVYDTYTFPGGRGRGAKWLCVILRVCCYSPCSAASRGGHVGVTERSRTGRAAAGRSAGGHANSDLGPPPRRPFRTLADTLRNGINSQKKKKKQR